MIKNLLRKIWNRFWRRQDKKLEKLQKKVDTLDKKLNEQKKQTQELRNYIKQEL